MPPDATASPIAGTQPAATSAGTTTSAAATTAAAAGVAGTNGEVPEWAKTLDADTQAVVTSKKWPTLADAVKGYANLEKLVRAGPVESLVRVPAADADEATRNAFFDKIGRPAKAEDYKVPDTLKDDPIAAAYKPIAHSLGITAAQFEKTVNWVAEQGEVLAKQQDTEFTGACTKADGELRGLWGQAYDRNVQAELAAQRMIGLTDDEVVALARESGPKSVRERLAKIGLPLLEGEFKTGDQKKDTAMRGLSPAEAKERFQSLSKDPDWMRRIKANDPAALKEKRALNAMMAGQDPDEAETEWQRSIARRA